MQTRDKFYDDISKLFNNAVGVAKGAKEEAENMFDSWMDRWLAERNLVTREEFDAIRILATKLKEENDVLRSRIDHLESKAGHPHGSADPSAVKNVSSQQIADRVGWTLRRLQEHFKREGVAKIGERYIFTEAEAEEIILKLSKDGNAEKERES